MFDPSVSASQQQLRLGSPHRKLRWCKMRTARTAFIRIPSSGQILKKGDGEGLALRTNGRPIVEQRRMSMNADGESFHAFAALFSFKVSGIPMNKDFQFPEK
ncbi:hypothetical protein E4U40_006774 [Claviceps sp. LM458 group G5]|nr:hypothetical protein E4U40_006774 [Claviceps sp. LM458 group G5]